MANQIFSKILGYLGAISVILAVIVSLITIVGGIYGLSRYIDSRIEHFVNDPKFIRKISTNIRPYVIFDENETIHVDMGAMQYLEKIEVDASLKNKQFDAKLKIIATPKEHLAYAPLMENLSIENIQIPLPERGRGHQWIYNLYLLDRFGGGVQEPMRFRLEILR